MRVLIAEDDEELAGTLAIGLRRENMAVDVALDGTSAAEKVTLTPYDVVVLDRDLPGVHGDTICRTIVGTADRPVMVLMLTASGSPVEHVGGLSLGADDYLAKPFPFPRARAQGPRPRPPPADRSGPSAPLA